MTKRKVLVVAAHPDDEVLGCGGAMAAHADQGDEVHVLILAQGLNSRGEAGQEAFAALRGAADRANRLLGVSSLTLLDFPDNRLDGVDLLDLVKAVEAKVSSLLPEIVYTHFANDLNVDHRVTHHAAVTACRPLPGHCVRTILCFEVPSSTEWSGSPFAPNWFIDIGGQLERKQAALAAYAGEMRAFPHPRSIEGAGHLAAWRGASAGFAAAEAFVLFRHREI
ncbi:GlcNAc-PI de-N-acetylase [Chromobacterium phragmitis]|uniref:GlcNAc-PI de-N-acetylase n=1 Tax=Chromobacterium phragmitis TaxID=2202141 RepID=A0A344UH41_9NEIS|nr:PIG-L deacetylase family protein [Chromobacterium phragmitis]AXE29230.1 GlcNAc-PI de-N-acetylase [Chromobacterium phragmitis]AXE34589.1 GlcNAc-PI de-N-acetylase [Chromobacterium phragmitis]